MFGLTTLLIVPVHRTMADIATHDVPEGVDPTDWTLGVTGAVRNPLELTASDLASFEAETFVGNFACEEGWVAEGLDWRGVRVGRLLDRAGLADGAEYGLVRSMDDGYACAFSLDRLAESVLAVELDGEPLGVEHGGPARLVPTDGGRDCWESVKWATVIEVREDRPSENDTAQEIALSRIE